MIEGKGRVLFGTSCLLGGLLLAGAAEAVTERGRVTGKVESADGKPLSGLELTFKPTDPSLGEARSVETNKKARFADLRFPAGKWLLDPRVGDSFIDSVTYSLLDRDGLKRAGWGAKAHPRDGLPPIEVPPGATIRLDVVLAPPGQGAELSKSADWADNAQAIERVSDLFNAGQAQEALEGADALLAKDPDLGPAVYLKGASLNRLGRRSEAITVLQRARELMPDQPGVPAMLGEALLGRALELAGEDRSEEARPYAAEAAGLLAADVAADGAQYGQHWNYGLALKTAENDADLQAALERMISLWPDQPDPYQELAELHFRAGRDSEALALLEGMPAAGGTNGAILLFNEALGRFDADQHDAALALVERAKALDPAFAVVHNLESQILLSQGDRPAAIAALKRFLELAPAGTDTSSARRTLEALEKQAAGGDSP